MITAPVYINLSGETTSTDSPLIHTTANNRTNGSMQNTTSTKKSADVADNTSSVSASVSTIQMSTEVETSPNQSNVDKTDISRSPSPQQGPKSNTEVLSVLLDTPLQDPAIKALTYVTSSSDDVTSSWLPVEGEIFIRFGIIAMGEIKILL